MTTDAAPRVLLVEDDQELADLLDRALTREGYAVEQAADGQAGLHRALTRDYAVLVVDRGLPAIEGLDLITRLRTRGVQAPVLVLSARGTPDDRVDGLDAGAEDYLTKPFHLGELLARLRALRRRHLPAARSLPLGGNLRLDLDNRTVTGPNRTVSLSERECALLALLAAHPGQMFTRRDVLAKVFPDSASDAAVDTYVHYLRRKLGRSVITTVHGRGYRLGTP